MRDQPDGSVLEALARVWDEANLAQLGSGERELMLAMIARARAIAERERAAGEEALAPICASLERLYGPGDPATRFRRLADEIRAGRFDPPAAKRDEVKHLLWTLTLQKLRESNPGFLAAHGLE